MQALFGLALNSLSHSSPAQVRAPLFPQRILRAKAWWTPYTKLLHDTSALQQSPRIPQIIHQSWKTRELKPFQEQWQKTWIENHPTWTYMFWTDKDNRDLVADKFPWFLDIYDNLPSDIERADCARYFYMMQYGGCYFDLDFESIKPLEPLLEHVQVALAYMTQDTEHPLSIPNAFAASVPGHNFWLYVIKHMIRNYECGEVNKTDVFKISGPYMLKDAVEEYQSTSITNDLTIFPPTQVYGVDWNWNDNATMHNVFKVCHAANVEFNATKCKTFFPDAYSITYWSGDLTWGG